jgi:transcriptional regulator GlxA family with amidase domain
MAVGGFESHDVFLFTHHFPLREIRQLGFYDAFHFSKTFKRYWKKPPSACRPS